MNKCHLKSYMKVLSFFEGDVAKTKLWFKLANPMLGDVSPNDMLRLGLGAKLDKFIANGLNGNFP